MARRPCLGSVAEPLGSGASAQASVAVNISPLSEAAAKIGSTIRAILRMGFLLVTLAISVRICNVTISVEIASAKGETVVAHFATSALAPSKSFLHRAILPCLSRLSFLGDCAPIRPSRTAALLCGVGDTFV
jgi:hypothetical protein